LCAGSRAAVAVFAAFWTASSAWAGDVPQLPHLSASLPQTETSYAFSGSEHQQRSLDLRRLGYIESEYLMSGEARVYDRAASGVRVLARGPYTTRILVRRPVDDRRFSGTVIVEPMNPSDDIDLPIMWAESYEQFIAEGDAWVGITIKPNTIAALKRFDAKRYARLAMPNPQASCAASQINAFSEPTTSADETGLAWDMLSEIGALLLSRSPANPLTRPAARLYMTGQSQTAGYARQYASLFNRREVRHGGKPLFDGFLYSGSPPWQVPINQCSRDLPAGDPRLITAPAGVPVIEIFTQADMTTNLPTRRPDSDRYPDQFRRYEVAGAPHVDPWEMLSFASDADAARAHGRLRDNEAQVCLPKGVTPSDFPVRYAFDAAWRILEAWVGHGIDAQHASPLEVAPGAEHRSPDQMFVLDALGNAQGGVRSSTVDVPTARWVGAKSGPFICLFHGYRIAFDREELRRLYRDHADYVAKVQASAVALMRNRWLTPVDAAEAVRAAERSQVP
jgi:Alpha/beta hydrolase domain